MESWPCSWRGARLAGSRPNPTLSSSGSKAPASSPASSCLGQGHLYILAEPPHPQHMKGHSPQWSLGSVGTVSKELHHLPLATRIAFPKCDSQGNCNCCHTHSEPILYAGLLRAFNHSVAKNVMSTCQVPGMQLAVGNGWRIRQTSFMLSWGLYSSGRR